MGGAAVPAAAGKVFEDRAIRLERLTLEPFGTNAYLVTCMETGEKVLVDAPAEAGIILEALRGARPGFILLTHGHMDHLMALEELRRLTGAPLAAHPAEAGALERPPEQLLQGGETLPCGKVMLEVIHTPGHTPGSLCFLAGPCLVAGDTLFPGGPGKTASPENFGKIVQSITEKLFLLPAGTLVLPGHGGHTVLEREKKLYDAFASRPRDPNLCGDVLWEAG